MISQTIAYCNLRGDTYIIYQREMRNYPDPSYSCNELIAQVSLNAVNVTSFISHMWVIITDSLEGIEVRLMLN